MMYDDQMIRVKTEEGPVFVNPTPHVTRPSLVPFVTVHSPTHARYSQPGRCACAYVHMHAIPARHKFSSGTVVATNDGREQPKKTTRIFYRSENIRTVATVSGLPVASPT